MFYKIVQLLKMYTILRKKIISLKNLYYILKFKSKNPIIFIKSNKISVMQIAILMIFGSSVSKKNMRITGHTNPLKKTFLFCNNNIIHKNTSVT
jgi:hypothetical protein